MNKKALVIGHRQFSQGAYGSAGISEYEYWTDFMEDLLPLINEPELCQIFTRQDGLSGYTERMKDLHKRIDKFGAKYSISFHFNSYSNPSVSGHEILYCSRSGERMALQLDELFDAYLQNDDRNIKKRSKNQRGGGFLCRGRSICILIEPFFASSQHLYIKGGDQRANLLQSLADFINEL